MQRRVMDGWHGLHDMALGQAAHVDGCDILRVPGGWLFTLTLNDRQYIDQQPFDVSRSAQPTFVPFSAEFYDEEQPPVPEPSAGRRVIVVQSKMNRDIDPDSAEERYTPF